MTGVRAAWIRLKAVVLGHRVSAVVATGVVLAGLLVVLWWRVGGNVSGWVTNFVVVGLALLAAEIFDAADAFLGLSKRLQIALVAAALVLAAAGGVLQFVGRGTKEWYLAGLTVAPILLIGTFLGRDNEIDPGAPDFFDGGPWTAP